MLQIQKLLYRYPGMHPSWLWRNPRLLPAGPEGAIEIKGKTSIKYPIEPIFLSGKISILTDDPMGLYYRLTDATLTSAK